MHYKFLVTVDTAALIPEAGQVIAAMNKDLETFGEDQKLMLRTTIANIKITTDRPATSEELEKIRSAIEEDVSKRFEDFDVRVERAIESN